MSEITFGVWLKRQRITKGLTQAELALQINCSTSMLKKIESEQRRPSRQIIEGLADAFDIPPDERESFLKFARGDWSAAPPEEEKAPWHASHLYEKKHNLPIQLTSFVGRDKELADIKRLLKDTHILTLVGPGGTGKTRLSIQTVNDILDQYPDGVWFVDFAPILDPELVPRTAAMTIGLRDEPRHRPIMDMLCDYLRGKKMLIILDNCEHLVDACAQLANSILQVAPDVYILASSREPLGIPGEVTYNVLSLGLPNIDHLPPLESLSQYEAVRLFIDRATSALPSFSVTNENAPALAQICYHLDGMPLAIELAAAKIRVLGLEQIAERLDDRFRLLKSGGRTVQERHQTLQAVVDWSYNLLSEEEQVLFRRLAVFVGGWTLEAAEAVCANETGINVLSRLEQLINKSLVVTEQKNGGSRYHMLETIRQYANEKLAESDESEIIRGKHLEFFLTLAETAAPNLYRREQLEWLAQLDTDYENLRAALEWAFSNKSAEPSLRLCAALGMYWSIRGYWLEGSKWLRETLEKPIDDTNQEERIVRVRALYQDGNIADMLDDLKRIKASAEQSFVLAQKMSNKTDIAIARFLVAKALYRHWHFEKALSLLEQCYTEFQTLNELYWQANCYRLFIEVLGLQGKINFPEKIKMMQSLVKIARDCGERSILYDILIDFSYRSYSLNRLDEAIEQTKEANYLFKQLNPNLSPPPFLFAELAWLKGNYNEAINHCTEIQKMYSVKGDNNQRAYTIAIMGLMAMEQGNIDQAQMHFEEALTTAREIDGKDSISHRLVELGIAWYLRGDIKMFKQNFKAGIKWRRSGLYHKRYILLLTVNYIKAQNLEMTANVLGALDNSKRANGTPITPLNMRYYNHAEIQAREVLGDKAFESAFVEGQKMSLDDALDLVLEIAEEIE